MTYDVIITIRGWAWGSRWEPLLRDAIQLSKKLESLGLGYSNGRVDVRGLDV